MAAGGGTLQCSPGLAAIGLPKQHYLAEDVIHQVKFSPVNIIQPERQKYYRISSLYW